MIAGQQPQFRLELKYHVHEDTAAAIVAAIAGICRRDRERPYAVHSLYFDNAVGESCFANQLGLGSRSKLRVRGYPRSPGTTGASDWLWLEHKAKVGDHIRKHRVRIHRAAWPAVLDLHGSAGLSAGLDHPDSFLTRLHRLRATPALHVRYLREAWASEIDDYARVTFDRRLSAAPANGDPNCDPDDPGLLARLQPIDHAECFDLTWSPVVLELKSGARLPLWMHHLIQRFQLQRTGTSKFGLGCEQLLPA